MQLWLNLFIEMQQQGIRQQQYIVQYGWPQVLIHCSDWHEDSQWHWSSHFQLAGKLNWPIVW